MFSQMIRRYLINPNFQRYTVLKHKPIARNDNGICRQPTSRSYTSFRSQEKHKRYVPWIEVPLLVSASVIVNKKDEKEKSEASPTITLKSPEDEVVHVIKLAKLAEMKQELKQAEEHYHKALSLLVIYQKNKNWEEARIIQARVYIYDAMANLALVNGQLEKAEVLFKETLRGLIQQGFSKEDDAVIEVSLKLAMIYAAQKKDEDAVQGYRYCIDTLENRMSKMAVVDDNTKALLGMSSDAYSRFLISRGLYPEAMKCLSSALDIARKVFGENHPQVAVLHNDIATVCSLMTQYDEAKVNLAKAIQIAEATSSMDLPVFHCNLGSLHMQTTDFDLAKEEYKKALVVAKKYNDSDVEKKANEALKTIKKAGK